MPASPRSRSGAPLDASRSQAERAQAERAEAVREEAVREEAVRSQAAAAEPAPATADPTADPTEAELREGVDDLSFREAQVALELVLSQLQASDLDVEAMVELHRRGQAYAERCETLLSQVEQEVRLWDPDDPDGAASPYPPGPS